MTHGQSQPDGRQAAPDLLDAVLDRSCGIYDSAPPSREAMLGRVLSGKDKEENMLYRLFAGRSLASRLAIALGLFICLFTAAALWPQVRLTQEGPKAQYPPAWAEQPGHVLIFDFGRVYELPPGSEQHAEGPFMTLALAEAVLERLRAEVRYFRRVELIAPQLQVFRYHFILRNEQFVVNYGDEGWELPGQMDEQNRFVACLALPDPALAPQLIEFVKDLPLLPAGQLVNSTWFVEKGLPEPGLPGVTIGVELPPVPLSGMGARKIVPSEDTGHLTWSQEKLPPAASQRYHVFSYPQDATEEQIEAQLGQWMSQTRPDYEYSVDVTLESDRYSPGVKVEIVGRSEIDARGTKSGFTGHMTEPIKDKSQAEILQEMISTERGRKRLLQMEEDWRASGQEPPWPTDWAEVPLEPRAEAEAEELDFSMTDPNVIFNVPEARAKLRESKAGRAVLRDFERAIKLGGHPVPWEAEEGLVAEEETP